MIVAPATKLEFVGLCSSHLQLLQIIKLPWATPIFLLNPTNSGIRIAEESQPQSSLYKIQETPKAIHSFM